MFNSFRYKRRKEEKKLKQAALDYDKGFKDIRELFTYILTYANVYKTASKDTVEKLENFR